MKQFKVTYVRHGLSDHTHDVTVSAVSAKMAIKKFWNMKDWRGCTNRQNREYERQASGIWWSEPTVVEI